MASCYIKMLASFFSCSLRGLGALPSSQVVHNVIYLEDNFALLVVANKKRNSTLLLS